MTEKGVPVANAKTIITPLLPKIIKSVTKATSTSIGEAISQIIPKRLFQ